jgi:hypothetical protein
MGGIGSGRHRGAGKATTDEYRSIDIRDWKRDGFLINGNLFGVRWLNKGETVASITVFVEEHRVRLVYRARDRRSGIRSNFDYPVFLEWTPCHLGGQRPWFRCPGAGCGKRVALLYGGQRFLCRHCQSLSYESQRETWDDRAIRKANRIRRKLGWRSGIANGHGPKPPGMHWLTFWKLAMKHDRYVTKACEHQLALLRQNFDVRS